MACDYADLTDRTEATIDRICGFADLETDTRLRERSGGELPLSRYTQTAPDPDKWRRNESEILPVLEPGHDCGVADTWRRCLHAMKNA